MSYYKEPADALRFWSRLYWLSALMLAVSGGALVAYTATYPNTFDSIRPFQYACFGVMAVSTAFLWLSYLREEYWKKR